MKLSDFGLAREGPDAWKTHISTMEVVGTLGYLAPEYMGKGAWRFGVTSKPLFPLISIGA